VANLENKLGEFEENVEQRQGQAFVMRTLVTRRGGGEPIGKITASKTPSRSIYGGTGSDGVIHGTIGREEG